MTEIIIGGITIGLIIIATIYLINHEKENRRKEYQRLEEETALFLAEQSKKEKEQIKKEKENLLQQNHDEILEKKRLIQEKRKATLKRKKEEERKLEEEEANAKAEAEIKKTLNKIKRTEREKLKKLNEELINSRESLATEEIIRQQTKKSNWKDFQHVLQQNNITKLYHFTDRANLISIRTNGGLYSWYYCQQNNIKIPKPGGSEISWIIDQRKGLQNYVRVSFVRDHPMLYIAQNDGRINDPIILEIDLDQIYELETRYANKNAAKTGVSTETTFEQFNSIKFPLLKKKYLDLSAEERPFYQAEILILEKIPLESITNINSV